MSISIGGLFTLIIVLVAVGILLWLAYYVIQQLWPTEPFARIARVVVTVIAVLVIVAALLNFAGVWSGGPVITP